MTAHLKSLCFYASDLIIYIHPGWRNPKSGNWNKKNSWGSFQPWQFQDTQSSDHHNLSQIIIIDDPWSLIITGWWFQPLSKIWKSVGVIIPNMENKKNVPNHQLIIISCLLINIRPGRYEANFVLLQNIFWSGRSLVGNKELPTWLGWGKTCPNLRGTWKMSFSTGMAG